MFYIERKIAMIRNPYNPVPHDTPNIIRNVTRTQVSKTGYTLAPDDLQRACRYRNRHGKFLQPDWKDAPSGRKYYPSYNITPGAHTPVLLSGKHCKSSEATSERVLQPMMWGLVPSWHKGSISEKAFETNNCRAEGMLEKNTYKIPLQKGRRCVVLAEGFYEWKRGKDSKQPYYIYFPQNKVKDSYLPKEKEEHINVKEERLEREDSGFYDAKEKDSEENSSMHRQDSDLKDEAKDECGSPRLLTMAGVFDIWQPKDEPEPVYSYSVITVESCPAFSWIHHRMPAMLTTEEEVNAWLEFGEVPLTEAVKFIRPVTCLESHPVSSVVNNSRNNKAECIEKIEPSKPKMSASSSLMSAWLAKGKVKKEQSDGQPDKKPRLT